MNLEIPLTTCLPIIKLYRVSQKNVPLEEGRTSTKGIFFLGNLEHKCSLKLVATTKILF